MMLRYSFLIYNAKLAKGGPQLQIQVRLTREGQPVFAGEAQPFNVSNQPDLKRLAAGGSLRLAADMGPGEYILQVIVSDALAKEKYGRATQWIDFEIVK